MKTIIKIFMHLYCRKEQGFVVMDERNYLHGFLGSLVWAFAFLVTAELKDYENWVLLGALLGFISAFFAAIAWELIQDLDKDKRFTWRDVWATNIWFIPLWFLANIIRKVAPTEYREVEKEFLK